MTKHDKKLHALAAKIKNLPPVEPSSWWDYIPLGLLFLCLLVFDTETRTQRTLLCLLMLHRTKQSPPLIPHALLDKKERRPKPTLGFQPPIPALLLLSGHGESNKQRQPEPHCPRSVEG
jgi:hypothetical protein